MQEVIRALLNEPRPENAPRAGRWDKVVVALLGAALEPQVAWRPVAAVLVVITVPLLLIRRQRPLAAVAIAFGLTAAADAGAWIYSEGSTVVGATLVTFIALAYALARWGSGREIPVGLVFVMAANLVNESPEDTPAAANAVVASTLWLFVAAVGIIMRTRARSHERRMASARLAEREILARELHDSVAHHVSAIAIQAQAGQLMAARDPDSAISALGTIENAASQTLSEMRKLVSALRSDDSADMRPSAGIGDLVELV
ncbi:MAG: histidine kinase dimerization/phosphoacceptor domain-containing protein, partial [Actinomycetota bacterium]|nr:histidine kinase dimerization/phosphoacceptor domain-containing protein [Actinomycetota bacterium]